MDRLESLGNQLSQLTVYDIKSMYNQAKNMVLNVSEMEAKVREATNDEPWGASSTLMMEIAQGTFNFQNFNEIMPCIYARFMEKEARQWREIYKALQLLEFLVKNGSERVVDDARSHISTIKMLRSFHYIDEKGKDQGINIRHRAKELVELLSDVEKIRIERRKAKSNRTKYTGVGNDALNFSSGGSRYGGFGSDSLGGGGSGSYGNYGSDYSGYSGGSGGGFGDDAGRNKGFEEYDAGEDESTTVRRSGSVRDRTSAAGIGSAAARRNVTMPAPAPPAKEKEKAKAPEVDLLGSFDEDFGSSSSAATATAPAPVPPALASLDDEFGDFAAAPTSPTTTTTTTSAAPAPAPAPAANVNARQSLMEMFNSTPAPVSSPVRQTFNNNRPMSVGGASYLTQPAQGQAFGAMSPMSTGGNRASMSMASGMGMGMGGQTMSFGGTPLSPTQVRSGMGSPALSSQSQSKPGTPAAGVKSHATSGSSSSLGAGAFDDLWSMSLGSSTQKKPATPAGGGKKMLDLQKEKTQAAMWGGGSGSGSGFGGFGSGGASNANAAGGDDLLL